MRQLWLAKLEVVDTLCIIYSTHHANVGSDGLGRLRQMGLIVQDTSVSCRSVSESITLFP